METLLQGIAENWTVWFVTVVLIVAAIIDGAILKVPNWLTFPFIACGWLHWTMQDGMTGLGWSLLGTFVGMMLLLVLRNVGGMGAGDVKLLGWCRSLAWRHRYALCICRDRHCGGSHGHVHDPPERTMAEAPCHGTPDSARVENCAQSSESSPKSLVRESLPCTCCPTESQWQSGRLPTLRLQECLFDQHPIR